MHKILADDLAALPQDRVEYIQQCMFDAFEMVFRLSCAVSSAAIAECANVGVAAEVEAEADSTTRLDHIHRKLDTYICATVLARRLFSSNYRKIEEACQTLCLIWR